MHGTSASAIELIPCRRWHFLPEGPRWTGVQKQSHSIPQRTEGCTDEPPLPLSRLRRPRNWLAHELIIVLGWQCPPIQDTALMTATSRFSRPMHKMIGADAKCEKGRLTGGRMATATTLKGCQCKQTPPAPFCSHISYIVPVWMSGAWGLCTKGQRSSSHLCLTNLIPW